MRRNFFASILAGAMLLLAGCMDSPVESEGVAEGHARLALNAVASASAATLVVQVTGPGIGEPLVFNLPVVNGVASGSLDVPVGSSRVFSARLYDAGGSETHRGEVATAVRPGANDAIALRLEPLNGQQPVDMVISSYTVSIVPPGAPAVIGRPLQMRAVVRDADGAEVPDAKVVWAVTAPTIARISPGGLVEFSAEGTSGVVAVYGGVAAVGDVEGMSAARFAEDRLRASFTRWWDAEAQQFGPGMMLSVQSFQHSAVAANWGMYLYSEYPRAAIINDPAHPNYRDWTLGWTASYEGIAALRQGRQAVGDWPDLRAKAFSQFLLGLHLGNVALLYDQGLVIDDTRDPATAELQEYRVVMTAALAHLDQAIALTQQGSFSIPADWTTMPISSDELRRLAYSLKARFRANVARTPIERTAVNWAQVIAEAGNGITSDVSVQVDNYVWYHNVGYYMTLESQFSQLQYQYLGMADQSGKYQTWINLPVANRHPVLPGGQAFAIITPDNRFPQGATIEAQRMNPGRYYQATASTFWFRPDRGTHRWSYYGDERFRAWRSFNSYGLNLPWFTREELDLLRAEGHLRTGNLPQAASLVNVSRVAAGLNATNAAGLNTSCVPRLPDGTCGNLFEMLKWEFRLETQFQGMFGAPWYFMGRGWGDLYRGTQLQLPVPCGVLQARGMACYTLGGVGGNSASAGSAYAWPFE